MREHGAEIKREGAKHTIWFIPATGQKSTVPLWDSLSPNDPFDGKGMADRPIRQVGLQPVLAAE
jgi:hypothetical protein